ncbi:MAG: T9SS type A sorting domain-containing protein [Bacteroidales bacterium]|nr:T9SS type A sorting domain-containing protein [Bacteroidales bacterium]
MKKLFITISMFLIANFAYSTDLYWQVNPYAFEFNMNVTATVYIDDVEQQNEMLELGVFCGDELRGSALPRLSPLVNKYIYDLTIYSDQACDLSFKLYDHSTNTVSDLVNDQILVFVANGTAGNAFNPYVVNFTTPIPAVTFTGNGSWEETSNWQGATLPTETDDVVIDGDALISNEVVIKSLVINAGKSLTIQNGGILTVTETITNTDYDALIIEDGGQIIQTNENVAATFKKNIVNPTSWSNPVSGWQFISSPMLDAATEGFVSAEGDYDLYKFDGAAELQWVNYKKHDDFEETFTPGVGYIASYESQTTASFQGTLNNETEYFDFGIDYNSSNDWVNFNLLGNPFCFDIVWEDNIHCKKIAEDGFITLNSTTGGYVYNVEGVIKPGEGFMVYAETKRVSLEYYKELSKSRNEITDYINVIASNNNTFDNVIIRLGEKEVAGLPKLDNINPNIAEIYVKNDERRYGIFSYSPDVTEILLHFDAKEMGNYTLTFDINGNYENLYLIDKMTGERVNLLLENEYTFTAMSNDNPERFIIKMDNSQQTTDNSHFAYISGEELFVNAEGTIQIIDLMGRVVMTEENHSGSINIGELKNAAYIVRCVNEKEVRTQKIVVL